MKVFNQCPGREGQAVSADEATGCLLRWQDQEESP